jgi:outer membrane protein
MASGVVNLHSMKRISLTLLLSGAYLLGLAQDVWDLRRCVDFAIANNIQVRQNQVQEQIADVNLKQANASRFPTLNFQTSTGGQFGRSIDPATNLFTTNSITFINNGLSTNVTLFNWFSVKNQVEATRLTAEAARAQTEVIQNDISLNVAAAYLQALLSHEQMRIARVQVDQTMEQLAITRKRVDAGALPELNAAELSAQLARDSATFVAAQSQFELNQLSIKSILNLDAAASFRIAVPPAELIPVEPIADLQPDLVFTRAVAQQPRQRANQLRLEAAMKSTASARGALYPTISAFGNLQTAYSSAFENLPKGQNITTVFQTQSFVNVSGSNYFVNTPVSRPESFVKANVWRQFDFNRRQSIGLGLSVPIFNGLQARSGYQRAKLNESTIQLQMTSDTLQLKQDIYQAYQSAVNSMNNFNSRQRSVEAAEYSYELGQKRYEVGLLPVIELVTLQNNLQRSRIEKASAQYEYIFRLKVLEFYKNNSIKL